MTPTSSSCLQCFSTPVLPSAPILTQVRVIDVTQSSDLCCCCVNILSRPGHHHQHQRCSFTAAACGLSELVVEMRGFCRVLPTAACRVCLRVCHQSEGDVRLHWKLWSTLQMQTPGGVLVLVLSGLCDGENQCNDTDGSELVAATSVGRAFLPPRFLGPYTAGVWGCFVDRVQSENHC